MTALLHQVALRAVDPARATDFWTTRLGARPIAAFGDLSFLWLGETRLLLEPGAPAALVYLRVDSVRDEVERLRADGVAIETEPHVIFTDAEGTFGDAGVDEWMAFLRDSEGNLVGLASREPAEV
ncbi:VOC family protein [Aestuariimicrobium soli]|uniref:VOC family protein n=1 Tax=Aestuariimicrobium soli TaxID=2035834 RepID=UPI003EBA4337